jgi:hypothetical protein
VAYLGVNRVGKIQRCGPLGEFLYLSLGSEDVHLIRIKIHAHVLEEFSGIVQVLLPFHHLAQPIDDFGILGFRDLPFFVGPVGRDSFFRDKIHLVSAYLDFYPCAFRPDDRGMEGLVTIALRHGYVVFEPARHRTPKGMDKAQDCIALTDTVQDYAKGGEVVNLVKLQVLSHHLMMYTIDVLITPFGHCIYVVLLQLLANNSQNIINVFFGLLYCFIEASFDVVVLFGFNVSEGKVLEFCPHPIDSQACSQGRVDLHGFSGDSLLSLQGMGSACACYEAGQPALREVL